MYNGLYLGLRGQSEHKNLLLEQFSVRTDITGLKYIEVLHLTRKNNQGDLETRKFRQGTVKHFDNSSDRSYVKLIELYLSACNEKTGAFYRHPVKSSKIGKILAFSNIPLGDNKLRTLMKDLFRDAGIDTANRVITNHSGRVSCVNNLLQAGITRWVYECPFML